MIKNMHESPPRVKFKKIFNIFSMFWCIVFVVKISMMLAGCSQTGTGNGEEQTTTVDGTEEKVDAEKVRLDAMDPSAYGNVEGLDLEAGTYISVIGKASGGDFWDSVQEGAQKAISDIN